jgi:hypothetical protein
MNTAIEGLEKLAEEARQHLYRKDRKVDIDDIEALLPRLRTEERDGKRVAFVAGAEAKNIDGWPLRLSEAQADSERRWP